MSTNMALPKILIVEDDSELSEVLKLLLTPHFRVQCVSDGVQGLKEALRSPPALILLDLKMPNMDGFQTCELIRSDREFDNVPIIVVSGHGSHDERARLKSLGANDFIAKPFDSEMLLGKIKDAIAGARESVSPRNNGNVLEVDGFRLDIKQKRGFYEGFEIKFSSIEMRLLSLLIEKIGRLVTRDEILQVVWSQQAPSQRVIDTHIVALRTKLSPTPVELSSVYGKGYILKKSRL